MTVGVLLDLLEDVAPEAEIRVNGKCVRGMRMNARFNWAGDRQSVGIELEV